MKFLETKFSDFGRADPFFYALDLLLFIKDQFQSPVQMGYFYIIHILRGTVAGMSHVADHISCRHRAAFFQPFREVFYVRLSLRPFPGCFIQNLQRLFIELSAGPRRGIGKQRNPPIWYSLFPRLR